MTLFYFVLAAIALGILVFFHELGHYFVAKKVGMTVETFSIGFGRPVLKWRWNDVDWQLGWLPFGGFVRIAGMEFGKKDKDTYIEPYEIPNGFFAKAPWRRISVAIAGPLANFILAFLIFSAIWFLGGREKNFSDFTKIVGWVDPKSELFASGLRPGDIITHYNGKAYTSSKDLLYATMLGGKTVDISGYHLDYQTGEKIPFSLTAKAYAAPNSLDGILTTGVSSAAKFLIYDSPNGQTIFPGGSPMENSGIEDKDRLVWADGELLFSMDQLSYLMDRGHALLTVNRNGRIFLSRQPRVRANDLVIPNFVKDELMDWQYETKIAGKWQNLIVLPYITNTKGYIESPLQFIDKETEKASFSEDRYSESLEQPLEAGDQILAVDGQRTSSGYEILKQIQNHQVLLMVKKNVSPISKISWKEEDKYFFNSLDFDAIDKLASNIGAQEFSKNFGEYEILNPITPKTIKDFNLPEETREQLRTEFEKQRAQVEKIKDREKRAEAFAFLEKTEQKLLLGVYLQDLKVNYNPAPWTMFSSVFVETWQTLKALVTGYLHPKWLSGPLGIVQVIHYGWKIGIGEALFWIGAISLNLAVLNLLPIPVLDGGYICLSIWEAITKKRLKAKTMERLILPFVVLLIALLVFLTFQDISRLF